ncbi:MAG: T9SS type A sorting domain-containing protein, partial [Muribaculaceae bacterium]|nr:T9SS type A sorting domain-containing protein [Muribaculaceae bacterium]
YYYSYIMPMSNFVGIDNISADSNANALSLSIDRSGVITIQGEAKALNVYDLNGRLMLNVENPGATVKTNLTPGSYVIKAENADTEAVAKAVL